VAIKKFEDPCFTRSRDFFLLRAQGSGLRAQGSGLRAHGVGLRSEEMRR